MLLWVRDMDNHEEVRVTMEGGWQPWTKYTRRRSNGWRTRGKEGRGRGVGEVRGAGRRRNWRICSHTCEESAQGHGSRSKATASRQRSEALARWVGIKAGNPSKLILMLKVWILKLWVFLKQNFILLHLWLSLPYWQLSMTNQHHHQAFCRWPLTAKEVAHWVSDSLLGLGKSWPNGLVPNISTIPSSW